MKKVFSIILLIIILLATMLTLTGCSTFKAYIYEVTTGDKIKVQLDTSKGYGLTHELPFKVTKDEKTLSQGSFITLEGYEMFKENIGASSTSRIIDKGTKNGVEYIFYSYMGREYNYIIKILDSNTAVVLGNNQSQEIAEKCFNLLTFSKE